MKTRRFVWISFFMFVTMLFAGFGTALAGAPYPPNPTSPGNGSTASDNPPRLCANVGDGDPEGDAVKIKFEAHDGQSIQHISPWLEVNGNGNICWTDNSPWGEGTTAWAVRSMAAGEQSGASGEWIVRIEAQSGGGNSGGGGGNGSSGSGSENCKVDDLFADRSAPQQVGTTVVFTANASCSSGVAKIKFFVDGIKADVANNTSSANFYWDTSGEAPGNHVISVAVTGNSGGSASRSHPYDLVGKGQSGPDNSCPSAPGRLSPGDIARVSDYNSDPLVVWNDSNRDSGVKFTVPVREMVSVISGPRCREKRRWVEVGYQGNSGWSIETEASGAYNLIPNGMAMPGPGGNGNGGSSGGGSSDSTCPSSPARLRPGMIAVVSNYDPYDLVVWNDFNKDSGRKFGVPILEKVSIISGPRCSDQNRWFEIGYKGNSGWAIEVGPKGGYNLIPNGDPVSSGPQPPKDGPPPVPTSEVADSSGSVDTPPQSDSQAGAGTSNNDSGDTNSQVPDNQLNNQGDNPDNQGQSSQTTTETSKYVLNVKPLLAPPTIEDIEKAANFIDIYLSANQAASSVCAIPPPESYACIVLYTAANSISSIISSSGSLFTF